MISAVALRVRDAGSALRYAVARGAWAAPSHVDAMELNIPAIHGVGATRIYFVDRYRNLTIYDVDFILNPGVDPHPPALTGLRWFGIVQYIGAARTDDWTSFYQEFFGFYPNGTPTPTITPTSAPSATPTVVDATQAAALTAAPTLTPTATLSVTVVPSPTITPTATLAPTNTPTPGPSPTATGTTASPSPSSTARSNFCGSAAKPGADDSPDVLRFGCGILQYPPTLADATIADGNRPFVEQVAADCYRIVPVMILVRVVGLKGDGE